MPSKKLTNDQIPADTWRGRKATDSITGFTGFVIGRYEFTNGCVRFEIQGVDKDSQPTSLVVDEQQMQWQPEFAKGFEPPAIPEPASRPATRGGPRDSKPIARAAR